MARTVSLRRSLLTDLLLLIGLLGGGVLAALTLGTRTAVRELSGRLIEKTAAVTNAELSRFFDPVTGVLLIGRQWGQSGLMDTGDPAQLVRLMGPILNRFDHISAAMIADDAGRSMSVIRREGMWEVTQKRPGEWEGRTRIWRLRDGESEATIEFVESAPGAGAAERLETEWVAEAMAADDEIESSGGPIEANRVYWTEPHVLNGLDEPGMTASIAYRTPGGRRAVLGVDVLLFDVSQFTITLHPSERGIAFVLDMANRMIGLPCGGGYDDPSACRAAMLDKADQLGMPLLVDGAAARARLDAEAKMMRFDSGGEAWWAGGHELDVGGGRKLLTVVVVPESDLLGDLVRLRYIVIAIMLGVLALAVLKALVVSRRVSRPIESLVAASDRLAKLNLDASDVIESRVAEIAALAAAQGRMRRALREFMRYMPTELVRELVYLGQAARVGGRTESLTVLFTDIVGFTGIAEHMDPQDLAEHMSEYFRDVMKTIAVHRGTIDKTMGDAVMAFWGAPLRDEFHAANSVNAVLATAERVDELNARWQTEGRAVLPTCFGLATGRVMVGNVGSPTRLSYTAIGDTVNLASRLQGLNREYGTRALASESVREAAGDWFIWRLVDEVTVRNKREPVRVYEPLGRAGEVAADRIELARVYEAAWVAYRDGRIDDAKLTLDSLGESGRNDGPSRRLRARCRG